MFPDHADIFREKLRRGQVCLGTVISFTDPTVTEALCPLLDFVWIDMEHNALSLETVQAHVMATKGSETTPLVRVPWNDPVLVKPVLDIGAAGVIVPMVRTPDDVRRAVAACLYPPEGSRGFGPSLGVRPARRTRILPRCQRACPADRADRAYPGRREHP
jgi:2-keto-3-deoxy-L-rhamnonate aldolase RhmA